MTAATFRRAVVIGLDGTPCSLLRRLLGQGQLPHLAALLGRGTLAPLTSTIPTVSSVAWASFMTGQNPAKHNIFGFTDRRPGTYDVFVPTSKDLATTTLWEWLNRHGKRVVVINVPSTYPPARVDGVLISGFLTPSVERACRDPRVVERLQALGYRIDADTSLARQSLRRLLDDIRLTFERRAAAALDLLEAVDWDFFMLHVMETDRLHHFFWEHMENGHPEFAPAFLDLYREIDRFLGRVAARLADDTAVLLLSDHGFCTVRREVYVNRWLQSQGLLRLADASARDFNGLDPSSRAFSLTPGRIYLNLRGREPRGSVDPADYDRVRDDVAAALDRLADPDTGTRIVARVLRREELFEGPKLANAPDLVAVPVDGYDLKGDLAGNGLTAKGLLVGMHTQADAFIAVRDVRLRDSTARITDVMPTILQLMGVPVPEDLDGASLL